MSSASGTQHVVSDGEQRAVVVEVGATLRSYEAAGSAICWSFAESELPRGSQGQVLMPWPNRLRDGRYRFGELDGNVPLDEPDRSNAIHGLVRWLPWSLVDRDAASVRLACELLPQPAYPFSLHMEVEYRLGAGGLEVVAEAVAGGDAELPFGAGFHPYLDAGPSGLDSCRLALPARRRVLLDERALPAGLEEVAGTAYATVAGDESAAARGEVGDLVLDDCFSDLRVEGGRWRAELLRAGEDDPVVLWADDVYRHIMCYSGDTLAPELRRRAVAVEPMTCPPDAFRSGEDLVVLAPGERWSAAWGIVPPSLA